MEVHFKYMIIGIGIAGLGAGVFLPEIPAREIFGLILVIIGMVVAFVPFARYNSDRNRLDRAVDSLLEQWPEEKGIHVDPLREVNWNKFLSEMDITHLIVEIKDGGFRARYKHQFPPNKLPTSVEEFRKINITPAYIEELLVGLPALLNKGYKGEILRYLKGFPDWWSSVSSDDDESLTIESVRLIDDTKDDPE